VGFEAILAGRISINDEYYERREKRPLGPAGAEYRMGRSDDLRVFLDAMAASPPDLDAVIAERQEWLLHHGGPRDGQAYRRLHERRSYRYACAPD